MRSFFTSSLDKIDPPSPFVNAMEWDSYRSQFRSEKSGVSGNRNCLMASSSLNPESVERGAEQIQNIPLIVQNTLKDRFTIELTSDCPSLAALDVDACFGAGGIDFLREPNEAPLGTSWLESHDSPANDFEDSESFDQELGLLESVQEIAISLARTPPKRAVTERESAN